MPASRTALRRELRARRRNLTAPQRIAAADALAARLLALPFAPASGYVAGYWAMDGEIALHMWQLRL
ncbi:MAG TPA: 5-formyltetrahydrofolate cyclo-ligase, partial [Lysobacter sp.]